MGATALFLGCFKLTDNSCYGTIDFDGEYFDVPKDQQDQEQSASDNEEEKEELDREMGDLGDADDQNIVDERLWNERYAFPSAVLLLYECSLVYTA